MYVLSLTMKLLWYIFELCELALLPPQLEVILPAFLLIHLYGRVQLFLLQHSHIPLRSLQS